MHQRPDVSVKLVLRSDDCILMLHRKSASWEFPGGRLEWGETPEQALKRELVEELNYTVTGTPVFVSLYNYISSDNSQHSVILHYLLSVENRPQLYPTAEEPDITVHWLNQKELSDIIPNPEFIRQIFNEAY